MFDIGREREHVLMVSCAFDLYIVMFSVLFGEGEKERKMSRNQSSLFQSWRKKKDLVHVYGLISS